MYSDTIHHIPATVDACPLGGRMHIRLRARRGDISAATLIYTCNKNEWLKARQHAAMTVAFTDSETVYFYASVPLTDTRFAYIFSLQCRDGQVRYLSEEGVTDTFDHALAYFSFFQYASQFPCDAMTVPEWVPTAVCYQIFPERFFMGDTAKDTCYLTARWGEKPVPKSFFGGDLVGVREKLPYLAELGVSLIYLTPVFVSPSNHKYDIVDYESVDPAFGGDAALISLVSEAHARGIRVMLDGVFNHMSYRHPFFRDALENGPASPYYDWFLWNGDGSYRTFGSVRYMPKLNTGNMAVIDYFCGVAVKWMDRCGVDGWRLDVSDEISHRFLRHFREAVLQKRGDAIIIGEDWHRVPRCLCGDEYDGTMNYAFTKACLDLLAFETIDAPAFRDRLVRLYHTYSVAAAPKMLNLLGSHDTDRFLSRVHGDGGRYRTAAAMLFFFPGIPCVYYGDEIGTEGGYDPDCRRCFDWDETHWDKETYRLLRRLAALKRQPALSAGDFRLTEEGGILTFTRRAPEQTLTLRVNATNRANRDMIPFGFEIQE